MDLLTIKTLEEIAIFFDSRKVGHIGDSGYRKTTELRVFSRIVYDLMDQGILKENESVFLDLGSGDGRVNIFMAYLCRWSIGIEIEDFILDEYFHRSSELRKLLAEKKLRPLPSNLVIMNGDSVNKQTHNEIERLTGVSLADVDIFYTYITLHDVFAELIRNKGKAGAFYLVYGFSGILPGYEGFKLVDPNVGNQNIAALYRKE